MPSERVLFLFEECGFTPIGSLSENDDALKKAFELRNNRV